MATTQEAGVVGFIDLRLIGQTAFVAYIGVTRAARGQGVATNLIARAILEWTDVTRLELDVFDDNAAARRLYDRLGFVDKYRTQWVRRDLPTPAGWTTIDDELESDAMLDKFGFSVLHSTIDGEHHKFGRIGQTLLNCFSLQDFMDEPLLAALRQRLPDLNEAMTTYRSCATSADKPSLQSTWQQIGVSVRASLLLEGSQLDFWSEGSHL